MVVALVLIVFGVVDVVDGLVVGLTVVVVVDVVGMLKGAGTRLKSVGK